MEEEEKEEETKEIKEEKEESPAIKQLEIYDGDFEGFEFTEGNTFRKEVARTGTFRSRSGKVVAITKQFFEDLIKNFKPDISPIPLGHDGMNDPSKNTGWVKKLFTKGESLFADMEFTDKDIVEKIKNGTIKSNSIGVIKGKAGKVLEHIALTLKPAISNLSGFEPVALENCECEVFEFEKKEKIKEERIMDEKEKKELEAKIAELTEKAKEAEKVAELEETIKAEKDKNIELEMDNMKVPEKHRTAVKILLEAGKSEEAKAMVDDFEKPTEEAKPVKKSTDVAGDNFSVKVIKESELEKMSQKELFETVEKVEKGETIVLPNEIYGKNKYEFETKEEGRWEFTDYDTALNQLNTGSFFLPKLWEAKAIMSNVGAYHFDEMALPASKANGETVQWQVVGTLSVLGTSVGVGTVTGTSAMTISTVTMNPQRYGNSVAWTAEINDWSVTDIKNNVAMKLLVDDYNRTMDLEAYNVLNAASAVLSANTVVCGTWNSKGTVQLGSVGTFNANGVMQAKNIRLARTILKNNLAKPVAGDSYVAVVTPDQAYSLFGDGTFIDAKTYADETKLLNGEIGKYMGVRFVEADNTIPVTQRKSAKGTGTSYTALMLGEEALGKGFDQPFKITFYPDDKNDAGYYKKAQWNARGRYARLKPENIVPLVSTIAQELY